MKFNFEATGIGSLPFKDPKTACRAVFDNFKTIPFWPQLPKRSYLENMYIQYSEGLPGLVLDSTKKAVYIDTSKVASDIERVYGKFLDGDLDFFKISEDRAAGLYEFLESSKELPKETRFLKGQITGPISYALFLTDQNKKAVIHDKDLFEILTKVLTMKARWQIKKMKKLSSNVIIFIDEPYLVSIGSSFVNVNIEDAFKKLDELAGAIKKEGAIVGLHCCGNTDWSMLLKRDIDILNFDAYNFMKEFSLYGAEIKNFLQQSKTIAWGIVPSSEAIEKETKRSLADKFRSAMKLLTDKGVSKDDISSLVTPSCGLGALEENVAKYILEATGSLSCEMSKTKKV